MYQLFHSLAPQRPGRLAGQAAVPSVDTALSAYLARRFRLPELSLAAPPVLMPAGWEAYLYRFRLSLLPAALFRPLVLRLYAGPRGRARACHEFAALTHVHRAGYPVPGPLLLEPDSSYLGGPFIVMEHVPGDTLLARLRGNFLRILNVPAQLAQMHVRLHKMPAGTLGSPPGSFLHRQLQSLHHIIREHELIGLEAGVQWLDAHRPRETASPRLLHLDFHPVNLIVRPAGDCVVIDWSEADVGDVHADLATTVLLLRHAPVHDLTPGERLLAPVARWALARRYLKVYGRQATIEPQRLDYYLAWACLRRLATYGMWLHAGPECNGSKPSAVRRVTPGHVGGLQRLFARLTGTMPTLALP
jgi:aminoglycoside phosphotransferase (APT) family kinase protein